METEGPELRQRRKPSGQENLEDWRDDSSKEKAKREAAEEEPNDHYFSWGFAFFALALARYFSAQSNLIHDCDEVFNYVEPLHYVLYKTGFQTWEYSSEFALRSWLYILLHAAIIKPVAWWYGAGPGKVQVFYFLRLLLGLLSAATEATLVSGTANLLGRRLGAYTLVLLCFTSGLFNASTSFLPSTFSMYAITLAVAALMYRKPRTAVAVAVVGVVFGWPFSVLATLPLVVYAFVLGGFVPVFVTGFSSSILALVISAGIDRIFYGKWTSSVLNLVLYNVFSGGTSQLFGVEGPLFYLRNGFNNFNFALPLALIFPIVALIDRRKYSELMVLVSPVYLWLAFMSLQEHKEERFLYPIYPLICLAAAATVEAIPDLVPRPRYHAPNEEPKVILVVKALRTLALSLILGISYSRNASLLYGYSAPLQVYQKLPQLRERITATDPTGASVVCVGVEWHRFPSSFFLPTPPYQIGWLDDGERGLLPLPFNGTLGGTASSPHYFNKNNQATPKQFLESDEICSFLVELRLNRPDRIYRGDDEERWQLVWQQPFLDNELSPALHRAIFIPWSWERKNTFGMYRLLRKRDGARSD
ncbi:unnamed protein product [Calypogeia fissa]